MEDHKIRCMFFSLIGKAKGADLVLDVASDLPKVEFHFYGRIEESFEQRFINRISGLPNAEYHGAFNSVDGDMTRELSQYDIHLSGQMRVSLVCLWRRRWRLFPPLRVTAVTTQGLLKMVSMALSLRNAAQVVFEMPYLCFPLIRLILTR